MSQRAGAIADRVLLHGGLVCLFGFLLLALAVAQHRLDDIDRDARALVQETRHPALLSVMARASYLGGQPGQVAVIVATVAMLWSRRRRWALGLPVAMAGIGLVQHAAKLAMDRPRPNLDPWGFPSAHVMSLVVLGGYLVYVVSLSTDRAWTRRALGAYAVVVVTVAYSRMYLEAHFLSDLVGGATLGFAYLAATIWAVGSSPRLLRALQVAPAVGAPEALLAAIPAGPPTEPLVLAAAATLTAAPSVTDPS